MRNMLPLGVVLHSFRIVLILSLSALLLACSKGSLNPPPIIQVAHNDWQKEFPPHWWQEIPREEAKEWEILPQDAGYREVILSKRNELGLLSNFAETPVVFHGVCYPTIEGFWQMMKYPEGPDDVRNSWTSKWKFNRNEVSQMNGFKAKNAGNYANNLMDKYRANWVSFMGQRFRFYSNTPGTHYQLIQNILVEKVRQNPEVLAVLLKTRDLNLRPDHLVKAEAPAEWHFYRLWMNIRTLIQHNQLALETQEDLSLKTCQAF